MKGILESNFATSNTVSMDRNTMDSDDDSMWYPKACNEAILLYYNI